MQFLQFLGFRNHTEPLKLLESQALAKIAGIKTAGIAKTTGIGTAGTAGTTGIAGIGIAGTAKTTGIETAGTAGTTIKKIWNRSRLHLSPS